MTNILIVEDDHDIAENLQLFVTKNGWQFTWLSCGESVVQTVRENQHDIVLLDVMLPSVNGIDCCKKIREFSQIPVIMMTAKVDEIDRLIGLEAGADDYVCKPFSAPELMLRIKAILKRAKTSHSERMVELDANLLTVKCEKQQLRLTMQEFKFFEMLYRHPGRIYSRQQIIDIAFPDTSDIVDRTIDSHVRNLRAKLKATFGLKGLIESVYGAGYRYVEPEKTTEPTASL